MRTFKIIGSWIIFALAFIGCENGEETPEAMMESFGPDNITTQEYAINAEADTTIRGTGGTILSIDKNSFVDAQGNPVKGPIELELKECLTKADMVLGNMTTISNGRLLESGGMIYINATANEQTLRLADNKSIGVSMPADTILEGMQLFQGVETEDGINWDNPVDLALVGVAEPEPEPQQEDTASAQNTGSRSNFGVFVKGYDGEGIGGSSDILLPAEYPDGLEEKLLALYTSNGGLMITKDSVIMIDSFEVTLVKMDELDEVSRQLNQALTPLQEPADFEGINEYYQFILSELGWANVDRFYTHPRNKKVDLVVKVENSEKYSGFSTFMIFKKQNACIGGKQKTTNTFTFKLNADKELMLPVGEMASIVITAYHGYKPYYAITTFKIEEKQTIDLELSPTTFVELKQQIERKL